MRRRFATRLASTDTCKLNNSLDRSLADLIAGYPSDCRPLHLHVVEGSGGLSGARIWRLKTGRGDLCLRRWPREHPSPDSLQFIHAVLEHAGQHGCGLVPAPIRRTDGSSFASRHGHLWEMTPWLPGMADWPKTRSLIRLKNAVQALAGFHRAVANFELGGSRAGPSPAVAERLLQLRGLVGGGADNITARMTPSRWPELFGRAEDLISLFQHASPRVRVLLENASRVDVRLQPCIRDIHQEHVLFQGDAVTGLIDFGAMRVDNVAIDLSRLLGSMAGDNWELWEIGLNAYEEIVRLSASDKELVRTFDRSSVLLSGMNWLKWIYVDGREFPDPAAVLLRIDTILSRLRHLAGEREV